MRNSKKRFPECFSNDQQNVEKLLEIFKEIEGRKDEPQVQKLLEMKEKIQSWKK